MNRLFYISVSLLIFVIEILIGLYSSGWVRNYLGDVLVVILIYALLRSFCTSKPSVWYILPTLILIFSFIVEFLQLWGFCDRFGITNRLLRIIIGTGFSAADLISYTIGAIPCYISDYFILRKKMI